MISQGAEAKVYLENDKIVKHRFAKAYRHKEIDDRLRKFRTRREAKVLAKLSEIGFCSPSLNSVCDKEMKIDMEFIDGSKLRDVFDENHLQHAKEIGQKLGILHKNDIIHADLTTSNMILKGEIFFIDYGLSFFSDKAEDKAVDLHLLSRALESKHHSVYAEAFDAVISGYKESYDGHKAVLDRLEKVKLRGRNKGKWS